MMEIYEEVSIPRQPELNIGTAGHVDHGKTTIIQALTGIWTAVHSEELKRGITIKIGYADMPIYRFVKDGSEVYWSRPRLEDMEGELVRVVSFVDCPGHESLMANMLSGAAVMDGAMLVIAANEPVPRPQTKEHTTALELLGVKNVVVVQNKIDLVSKKEVYENYEAIREFLSTTSFADAPIIPVSAIHNVNLHYLVEALYKYIPKPEKDPNKPLMMYVIRSFDVNKPGTSYRDIVGGILGGAILEGKISVGDEIEISPGYIYKERDRIVNQPLYAEVLSLSSGKLPLKEAFPGGLIGVQTDLDPSLTKSDGMVGNVVGRPGTLPDVLYEVTLEVNLFKYVVGTDEAVEVRPIQRGEPFRLNIGPATTLGVAIDVRDGRVTFKLSRPVVADKGWKSAIAARYDNKWRLIGVGEVV